MNICVLGLGYIGLPTSVTLALAGFSVRGVDIRADVVDELAAGTLPIVEPGLEEAFAKAHAGGNLTFSTALAPADAFIITVQTPHRERPDGVKEAELRFVETAARQVGAVLRPGNLVVLESTVPPGTCQKMEDILRQTAGFSDFLVAHCPERVIPGRILNELRTNDRIIGGRTPEATQRAKEIYEKVVTEGVLRLTDDITAELCKLTENTFRDINIAYANELSVVCERLGVDVFSLIELANCHPRVNILTPGVGVGGHCIAVDPWFIHGLLPDETPLIAQARRTNDRKPHFVAEQVASLAPQGARVCVLGLSYKPDVDDLRESPSLVLCHALAARGVEVCACEPFARQESVEGFRNLPLEQALGCDFLVVTLAHSLFRENAARIRAKPHYDCVGLVR